MAVKRGGGRGRRTARTPRPREAAERKARHERSRRIAEQRRLPRPGRRRRRAPTWPPTSPVPTPPFWGTRVVKGIPLADYAALLDERATFLGPVGSARLARRRRARPTRSWSRPRAGRGCGTGWTGSAPRASSRTPPSSTATSRPCREGDDVVVLDRPTPDAQERYRFTFPRQHRDRLLCLADFFRPARGEGDRPGRRGRRSSWSRWGSRSASSPNELFAANAYRDYLEVHGLSACS